MYHKIQTVIFKFPKVNYYAYLKSLDCKYDWTTQKISFSLCFSGFPLQPGREYWLKQFKNFHYVFMLYSKVNEFRQFALSEIN